MSVTIPVGGKMKEILVGFLALGAFVILCYGMIKYRNVGLFILYGATLILIAWAAYLIGACILGTI